MYLWKKSIEAQHKPLVSLEQVLDPHNHTCKIKLSAPELTHPIGQLLSLLHGPRKRIKKIKDAHTYILQRCTIMKVVQAEVASLHQCFVSLQQDHFPWKLQNPGARAAPSILLLSQNAQADTTHANKLNSNSNVLWDCAGARWPLPGMWMAGC